MAQYLVTMGFDVGGPESGPIMRTGYEMVEANSEEEANHYVEEEYKDDICFCGCSSKLATQEEIDEWNKQMAEMPDVDDLPFN